MQRAAVGRVVHVLVDEAVNNGQDYAAATITRVCEDGTINVCVHTDGPATLIFRGIPLFAERPNLAQTASAHPSFLVTETSVAWWPPHV
jgi:hypothetical protein